MDATRSVTKRGPATTRVLGFRLLRLTLTATEPSISTTVSADQRKCFRLGERSPNLSMPRLISVGSPSKLQQSLARQRSKSVTNSVLYEERSSTLAASNP